jgi:hypothetical protein
VRGVERHTFVCSECHVTEQRVVFIKDGRETDSPPMPMQAAPPVNRASMMQDEHVAAVRGEAFPATNSACSRTASAFLKAA